MSAQPPKKPVGRPKKSPDADVTFEITIPRQHYEYLEYLGDKKRRLGINAKRVAEQILISDLDDRFRNGYHLKEIPKE